MPSSMSRDLVSNAINHHHTSSHDLGRESSTSAAPLPPTSERHPYSSFCVIIDS